MDNTIICESCEALKDYAPDYLLNGITEKECGNLQQNNGLTAQPNHDNYEDIQDTINCGVFGMDQMIQAASNCDWKEVMRKLSNNVANILSSINCGDLGQWEAIEALASQFDDIYLQLQQIRQSITTLNTKVESYNTATNLRIDNLETLIQNIQNGNANFVGFMTKIIDSLTANGSWTGGVTGGFATGHGVASGNINIFSKGTDTATRIRTTAGNTEGDLSFNTTT